MAAFVGLPACSSRFGAPRPASEQGEQVLDLWRLMFVLALAIGGLVAGLILWSVVRYRRREAQSPASFQSNVPLELFYTAVPLVIVVVLFVVTLRVQDDVTAVTDRPDVRIDVTGFQWGWRFAYPDHGVTVLGDANRLPTMVLPLGRTTRLRLNSPDVIHAFYVPSFLNKRDVIPGVENRIDVTPTRAGRFGGHCAEFCGLDHGRMNFVVEVVPAAEFEAWAAGARTPAPPTVAPA